MRHPIPNVEELLESMAGAVKFSKVDLKVGYQQILLEEKSRKVTTFTTHRDYTDTSTFLLVGTLHL